MRRALDESEEKLQRKQSEAIVPAPILGKPSEVAAAKIIGLSKRCREQTAEIEVLKSKCKTLEIHLNDKEAELANERNDRKRSKANISQESEFTLNILASLESIHNKRENRVS